MPVLTVTTDAPVDDAVLDRLAQAVARALGIPPGRVMVLLAPARGRMDGSSESVLHAVLGFARRGGDGTERELVEAVVGEVRRSLAIAETRIYVQLEPRDGRALWRSEDGACRHAPSSP